MTRDEAKKLRKGQIVWVFDFEFDNGWRRAKVVHVPRGEGKVGVALALVTGAGYRKSTAWYWPEDVDYITDPDRGYNVKITVNTKKRKCPS